VAGEPAAVADLELDGRAAGDGDLEAAGLQLGREVHDGALEVGALQRAQLDGHGVRQGQRAQVCAALLEVVRFFRARARA
jgi:hypothetical protein